MAGVIGGMLDLFVVLICSSFLFVCFSYHWIKRRGRPAPRETAPIVVSNHVSYIEPIFFFYELFPTIVAAESHDSITLVGTIIRAMQVIFYYFASLDYFSGLPFCIVCKFTATKLQI